MAGLLAVTGCAEDASTPVDRDDGGPVQRPSARDDAGAREDNEVDSSAPTTGDGVRGTADAAEPSVNVDAAAPSIQDGAQARARVSIVRHELWRRLEASDDPFDDRLGQVDCSQTASMAELLADERVFSVDTGSCNYITVTQPSLRAVAAGETFKVRLWHFMLTAPEPAEAHAVVMVDGVALLDERVAIPGEGGLISRQVTATSDIPAGAPVYFHLHNHGANSWALVEVSIGR